MKTILTLALLALGFAGCGKNQPGTMGGEPGTPKTVATGAPADAAKGVDSSASSSRSEHASSTFGVSSDTNNTPAPAPATPTQSPEQK